MYEAHKEKYRKIIQNALAGHLQDDASRLAVYDKVRLANEKFLAKQNSPLSSETAASLRAALEDVIKEQTAFTQQIFELPISADEGKEPPEKNPERDPVAPTVPPRKGNVGQISAAFLAGAIIVALGFYGAGKLGWISYSAASDRDNPLGADFGNLYRQNLAAADAAGSFLSTIKDDIIAKQKNGASELVALTGKTFVKLRDVSPALASQLSKLDLPKGSNVILRADASDYKILFNWPLCATIQAYKPEMVDPKRALPVLGCAYFGIWTQNAADW